MLSYPDRRSRYKAAGPWDFNFGVGQATNTPQPEPKTDIAKRGLKPGDHFRDTTSLTNPVSTQADSAVPI